MILVRIIVNFEEALTRYNGHGRNAPFTFDPSIPESYDFNDIVERETFFEINQKNTGKIFVIGLTNNYTENLQVLKEPYNELKKSKQFPFIGKWEDPEKRIFTDISKVKTKNLSEDEILLILRTYDQESIVKLEKNKARIEFSFIPSRTDLIDKENSVLEEI